MFKAHALAMLAVMLGGCAIPGSAWKGQVEWPDDDSRKSLGPFTEAEAAIAAAAAVGEMVKTNPYPDLFSGCSTPARGLDVAVFTGPTPGLYYVLVDQRFDRCGGPAVRVLDGWYEYAVTAQGEVVGKAPPPPADAAFDVPVGPPPSPPEQAPPAAVTPEGQGAATPAPSSSPAPGAPSPVESVPSPPPSGSSEQTPH